MQHPLYRLACCSLLLGLSACNDNSNDSSQPAPQKQLASIETWTLNSQSKQLVQQENITVKYTNQRISEFNIYDDSGADKQWGTADDRAYSQVLCQFVGKTVAPVRDRSIQFSFPKPLFTDTVNGTLLFMILGINQRQQSLCALDYQNDASITEDEYVVKLGGDTQPATPFFRYRWGILKQQGSIQGSRIISTALGDLIAPTDNELHQREFNYAGTNNLLVDSLNQRVYRYTWLHAQPDKIEVFAYSGDATSTIGQLNSLPLLSSSQYHYSSNQIKICSGSGGTQILESYSNQQIVQRDYLNAGTDNMDCTSDDVLVKREKYNYQ